MSGSMAVRVAPQEVGAAAQRLEDENYAFRAFLKGRADDDELDAQFLSLHKELFAVYDCSKCANCCRVYRAVLSKDEAEEIARFVGQGVDSFIAERLVCREIEDDDEDENAYQFKEKPCAFLGADGRCRVQDCKPATCKGYPYTDRPDRLSSMLSILDHAEVCPVVFEILERLKVMYRFRYKRR